MTLRQIDVAHLDPAPPPAGEVPVLKYVDISDLRVDETYQRPMTGAGWAAVRRIADQFDWAKFGPLLVAPLTDGFFSLIDGQHRAHAAHLCGIRRVLALIVRATVQQQAQAFVDINSRQIRVTLHQVYRAALAASEPWALNCRASVVAAGCELMLINNVPAKAKQPGQVFAIDTVRRLVAAGHADAVTAGLSALRATEGGGPMDVALYDAILLRAWLGAVAAVPGAARADLAGALRKRRPWLVIEDANRLAAREGRPAPPERLQAFIRLLEAA